MSTEPCIAQHINASLADGRLTPEDLCLAAYLGDGTAQSLCEQKAASTEKLSDWVWGIALWGKVPLVRATGALARKALQVAIEHKEVEQASWKSSFDLVAAQEVLEFAEKYLMNPQSSLDRLSYFADLACRSFEVARLCAHEASGVADRVLRRERAAAAFEAIERMIAILAWQPSTMEDGAHPCDEHELHARNKSGPALEAWQSVQASKFALEWDSKMIVRHVQLTLIPWAKMHG